jgi:hypothetical protein
VNNIDFYFSLHAPKWGEVNSHASFRDMLTNIRRHELPGFEYCREAKGRTCTPVAIGLERHAN